MKNARRYSRIAIGALLLISLIASSFGMVFAQEGSVLRLDSGPSDIPTIDPALSTDAQSNQVISMTYIGLTVPDEITQDTMPAMASSWDVSEDGLTYTFHLVEGIPWVKWDVDAGEVVQSMDEEGNPRYVTAHDFEYGAKRMFAPETASDYASVPGSWIQGAMEFNSGEGSVDDVAVKALDDLTLEITATKSAGFLPGIFGLWLMVAEPQWAIDEYGDLWTEPGNYESYGPYTVSEWAHDDHIALQKNPFWPGLDSVPQASIERIELYVMEASAALANWEVGELDVVDDVPIADFDRIKFEYPDEFSINPDLCSYYYGFNVEKEPVNNIHLRLALSYAVDRQSLIDYVLKGEQTAAQWFARPGLAAAPTLETHPDMGIQYDPAKAQEELQLYLDEVGYSGVDEIPPITLLHNTSEAHARIAQAIQQMWKETLGIEILITSQDFAVYLKTRQEDAPQLYRAGWCPDFADAHNYDSDVFRSDASNNDTNWANPEYDALVDEAATMTDNDARRELYAQAEEILVLEDAAIIPIYWYTNPELTHSNVERTFSADGTERFEKWSLND